MDISLFEIIGPVMLGPSSSGTAGMARLGKAAHSFIDGDIKSIDLCFHKRSSGYAGLRSHFALIGGILGYEPYDPVIRNAMDIAKSKDIELTGSWFDDNEDIHHHAVRMTIVQNNGRTVVVTGASVGGGSIDVFGIDKFNVQLESTAKYVFVWSDEDITADLKVVFNTESIKYDKKDESYLFYISVPKVIDEAVSAKIVKIPSVTRVVFSDPFLEFGFVPNEPLFTSYKQLLSLCEKQEKDVYELAMDYELNRSGRTKEDIWNQMKSNLDYMRECVNYGLTEEIHTLFGFDPGTHAKKMLKAYKDGKTLSGSTMSRAFAKALSVMEMGESMNRIVAAPTGGSAGIVPGCILTVQEDNGYSDEELVKSLFVAAAMGVVMYYEGANFSGMMGGCQGEIGVSSAIAAAALAYLGGTDPAGCCNAMALAMKNILGLVCDRIHGGSEVPCTTRNCIGVGNAFAGCDMTLAGIQSFVSPDSVIMALVNTQKVLPEALRGGCGALRCTPESKEATRIEAEKNKLVELTYKN